MRRAKAVLVMSALVVSFLPAGTSDAHTGWSVSGKVTASAEFGTCVISLYCFSRYGGYLPYNGDLPQCSNDFPANDADMSFRRLPARTAGLHKAKLTFTAAVGPVDRVITPGYVVVSYFRDFVPPDRQAPWQHGPCGHVLSKTYVADSPAILTIPAEAVIVGVSADVAIDLRWKLEGIAH